MSKELIERLRADAESTDDIGLCADAAERIEELEREVASRDQVFDAISKERHYQETKWGDLVDNPQSVGAYLTLMRVHLTRAENDWADSDGNIEALHCLRKVLAIGVACGEQHGMPCRPDTAPTLRTNFYSDDEHE